MSSAKRNTDTGRNERFPGALRGGGPGMGARLGGVLLVVLLATMGAAAKSPGAYPGGAGPHLPVAWAPAEILIRLAPRAAKSAGSGELARAHRRYAVIRSEPLMKATAGTAKVRGRRALEGWMRLTLPAGTDPRATAEAYRNLTCVEQAQLNYLRRECGAGTDSLVAEQWNLRALGWSSAAEPGNTAVLVAVIDSGVDMEHPDLVGQFWSNQAELRGRPGVDDDANGYVDDVHGWDFTDAPGLAGSGDYLQRDADPNDESGHGTHVAGIICARTDNGIGVAGVAPRALLMPLRAGFNLGGRGYLQDDDLAAAIVYAADNGARVINMSWGDPSYSPVLHDAIRYAYQLGVVLVAAAGNDASARDFFPARLRETVAVTAVDSDGGVAPFSNFGVCTDLAAPGVSIWSTVLGGRYGLLSGTSMAAAHVSGVAARLLACDGGLGPEEVRSRLLLDAVRTDGIDWGPRLGAGMAQVETGTVDDHRAVLCITTPEPDSAITAAVRIGLRVSGVRGWRLEWGRGPIPTRWHLLASGEQEAPASVLWDTEMLDSGEYALRLSGSHASGTLEDHVPVRLARGAPAIREAALMWGLEDATWVHWVQWYTLQPAAGVVQVRRDGVVVTRLWAPPGRLRQQVLLPQTLPAGVYEIDLQAFLGDLRGSVQSLGSVELGGKPPLSELTQVAGLPGGYLLPEITDLDGDGRTEIGIMPATGQPYSAPSWYQFGPLGVDLIHTSSRLFIPWGTADLDGDGGRELLAVDARRVRVLRGDAPGAFPERLIWEQTGVWGGESADLDGDGHDELFLRADQGDRFRVFEENGDAPLAEVSVLVNPTVAQEPDGNGLGLRQLVGDLDGDGSGELLAGDADGDLFVYESFGNDAYHVSWTAPGALGEDARTVGGGGDLDGDGRVEFIVAQLHVEPHMERQAYWRISVFESLQNDQFRVEWSVLVRGGVESGNGISVLDLDGDGMLEWCVALVPQLYVFHSTGVNEYAPLWHHAVASAGRPATGDWDQDGRAELALVQRDSVRVFAAAVAPLPPVAGLCAWALDENAVELQWSPLPGATGYRIWRDGQLLSTHCANTRWVDTGVRAGHQYGYVVAAVDSARGLVGAPSPAIQVTPEAAPRLTAVEPLGPRLIGVRFSAPMSFSDDDLASFQVDAALGRLTSVAADQGGRRALLGFAAPLPTHGDGWVRVEGLRSVRGVPLAADGRRLSFTLTAAAGVVRAMGAELLSPTQVRLDFSGAVALPVVPGAQILFDPPGPRIVGVASREDALIVELDERTPLLPTGTVYRLHLVDVYGGNGERVLGTVEVRISASDLEAVQVYPNPFDPQQGLLHLSFLPKGARVTFYDLGGRHVRDLEERDGDGGMEWDGCNESGDPVSSGVYYYTVRGAGCMRRGRLGVIRH